MLHADDLASLIIARAGKHLTAMKLQKLLYFTQAWHLATTDRPLFGERVKAWENGPVVPQVWHARKEPDSRDPANQDTLAENLLDEFSSDLIDLVIARYGSLSGDELSALTHAEQPWLDAREGCTGSTQASPAISCEAMAEFYREHRELGGRTAADLAACGIFIRNLAVDESAIDIDVLLADLGSDSELQEDTPWGSTNLAPPLPVSEKRVEARRTYSDA